MYCNVSAACHLGAIPGSLAVQKFIERGIHIIVAVHKADILAPCLLYPVVPGIRQPAVCFLKTPDFFGICFGKTVNDALAVVRRTVIDHKDLNLLKRLVHK